MKRIIPGFIALAALFTACTEEIENPEPLPGGTHTVTFIANTVETRTQVVEGEQSASYFWSEGDEEYLHIYENDIEAESVDITLENGGATCTIEATFPDTDATSFVYRGTYCYARSNSGNLKLPDTQSPKAASFDPQADVLISRETEPFDARPSVVSLTFGRVAVISKVMFTGMEAGEEVVKVTVTGSSALSGTYALATPEKEAKWNPLSKTLKFENFGNPIVDENGKFRFFFVSIPFDGTISISVTTDTNQYDKAIESELVFEVGRMARLGIDLEGYGSQLENGASYTLVDNEAGILDGADFIIVGENAGKYFALGAQTRNNRSAVEINAPVDGTITLTNATKAYPIRIESTQNGRYFLIDNNPSSETFGQYLFNDSSGLNNYLRSKDTPSYYCLWSIEIQDDGTALINNVGNPDCNSLYFNSGSGLFNDYKALGNNRPVALYVGTGSSQLPDPDLSFTGNTTVDVVWPDLDSFIKPILDGGAGSPVYYFSSNESVATIYNDEGDLVFLGNGEATIMAFSKFTENFKTGYTEYQINVSGIPGTSIDDAFTVQEARDFIDYVKAYQPLPTRNEYYVKGKVTEIVEGFNTDYGNATFYISDEDSEDPHQFEAYRIYYYGNHRWTEGDKPIDIGDEVVICCRFDIYEDVNNGVEIYESYKKSGYLASLVKNTPYFSARLSGCEISYEGGEISLFIGADIVNWTVSIDNCAELKLGDVQDVSISGSSDAELTVIIPYNEGGGTYTIEFSTDPEMSEPPVKLYITQDSL